MIPLQLAPLKQNPTRPTECGKTCENCTGSLGTIVQTQTLIFARQAH